MIKMCIKGSLLKKLENIIALNFSITIRLTLLILNVIHYQSPYVNGNAPWWGWEVKKKCRPRPRSISSGRTKKILYL